MDQRDPWISAQHSVVRFRKREEYTFHFPHEFGPMDGNNISYCNIILEHGGRREIKTMSCKMMEMEEASRRMRDKNANYFRPLVGFKQMEGVLCVGDYIGVPSNVWANEQKQHNSSSLWRTDAITNIITAGPTLIKLAREIVKSLTKCHQQQRTALGFFCNKLYIQNTSFKLCDPPDDQDIAGGMYKDLEEFVVFINSLVPTGYGGGQNILLFNELFRLTISNEVEGILFFSYFICHSPLFWNIAERHQFANAYDSIRKQYGRNFDNLIKLNSGVYYIDNKWALKIPVVSSDPLRRIFDYSMSGYPPNHLLMQYIRYCYHHYAEQGGTSFEDLDELLLGMFSTAISATYGEIALRFNSLPSSVPKLDLLNHLKYAGLIYID